ncbi:MAG: hypothetical protein LBB25_03095 [Holosporaceae bacterium]|jgi:mevalonate kinase|nr:hypothetical protein [Holosporaceae bacterium]
MNLFVGSKTFLVGEYSVLFGGSAIILVTLPEFKLQVTKGKTNLKGIDQESPAYCFYELHDFCNFSMEFVDPHKKSGGFGASSAQFVMLYQLCLKLTHRRFDINLFLREYQDLSQKKNSIKPSGADCIAQYYNHHIFFNAQTNVVEKLEWKFPQLDFIILKTKHKVVTHLHLEKLVPFDIEKLQNLTLNVKKSFLNNDEELLIKSVQGFFDSLKKYNLVIDQNIEAVDKLLRIDGIKAAKGCGAMGADTIIVIFEKRKKNTLLNFLQSDDANFFI